MGRLSTARSAYQQNKYPSRFKCLHGKNVILELELQAGQNVGEIIGWCWTLGRLFLWRSWNHSMKTPPRLKHLTISLPSQGECCSSVSCWEYCHSSHKTFKLSLGDPSAAASHLMPFSNTQPRLAIASQAHSNKPLKPDSKKIVSCFVDPGSNRFYNRTRIAQFRWQERAWALILLPI